MEKDVGVLIDYCEGRGEFSETSTFKGMEGSYGTSLLVNHIMKLGQEDRRSFCATLVKSIAGQNVELQPYLALLVQPFLIVAMSVSPVLLDDSMTILELEYNDPDNIRYWLTAEDDEQLPANVLFKRTWHYALVLARVLHALGSSAISETTNRLRRDALSPRLRSQLDSLS